MKHFLPYKFAFLSIMLFFLLACDSTVNLPYEFKDQPVQGIIQSEAWEIQEAVARYSLFSHDTLTIQLNNEQLGETCDYLVSNAGAYFTIPAQEGIYMLSSKAIQYQSVTLFDGGLSVEALGGAIEITLVDSLNNRIEGKIDATYDGQNQLNGYFSATLCQNQ